MAVIGSTNTVILGYLADIAINGTFFGVRAGNYNLSADVQETGDSINKRDKVHKGGRRKLDASLEFYQKSDIIIASAPLSILEGEYISLYIWENGFSIGAVPVGTDFFLVERVAINWDVDGKVQGTLSGMSSGGYQRKG